MTLEASVRRLLDDLLALAPWAQVLDRHGVSKVTGLTTPLQVDRNAQGFGDFAQSSAALICPGDPASSLLYHCLASPAVQPKGLPDQAYPTLEQIDLVENYIYSLAPVSEDQRKKLVPAVFAYEYREAARTPHQRHADLVYSRIGIGRVGNAPALYDAMTRSHAHAAAASHEVRVQPVRYAAFLCERVDGDAMDERRLGGFQFADGRRSFLVPVVKLFPGQKVGDLAFANLTLTSFHLTDRLRRLFTIGDLPNIEHADLDRPPFIRTSRNGGLSVETTNLGASLLAGSTAQPLVREVLISAGNSAGVVRRGTTRVPPRGKGIDAFNENRRYSTLRVGQKLFAAGLDYIGSALTDAAAGARVFLSPRNSPEFINMRHRQATSATPVEDLNLAIPDPATFEKTLDAGGYPTVLYADDICDGFVSAELCDDTGRKYNVAPAFSVITAPDFFPCVGSLDITDFASHFVDGGPSPLCEGRLRANARLRDPDTDGAVFNDDDTVAAAVSQPPRSADPKHDACHVAVTNTLTDGASNVFAPGWDLTYGRDGVFSSPYYHTAGLGSPFVEDAKLCASANGMWAAASPDAARTFNPARSPTAIPLTDVELGLHPDSPAAALLGAQRGWDGEYGPFFSVQGGALAVNFADVMRSDYVSNALRNLLRFDRLREVSKSRMIARLRAFGAVLRHLDGAAAQVRESERWLVSFQDVEDWTVFSLDKVLPAAAHGNFADLMANARTWGNDPGHVFGFVQRKVQSVPLAGTGRRLASLTEPVTVVIWRSSDGKAATKRS
jgi:hypothetical protein